jgi:cysteine-rich repeat protein
MGWAAALSVCSITLGSTCRCQAIRPISPSSHFATGPKRHQVAVVDVVGATLLGSPKAVVEMSSESNEQDQTRIVRRSRRRRHRTPVRQGCGRGLGRYAGPMVRLRWSAGVMVVAACGDDGAAVASSGDGTTTHGGVSDASSSSGPTTTATTSADVTGSTTATTIATSSETSGSGGSSSEGSTSTSADDGACVLPDDSSSSGEGEPPLDLGVEGGCGNGVVEGAEFCDDGNAQPGDGCENDCTSSDDVAPEFFLTMGGPNSIPDCGSGVAFDSQGNLILGGYVLDDVWIRKYDTEYQELWTVTYPGQPGGYCTVTALAVDSQDNIAFTGVTGELDNVDWIFGLLDPDGMEIWSETLDGPVMRNDYPHGIAVDGEDALVIVGRRENPVSGSEAVVLKYSNDGALLWSDFVSSGNGQGDTVWAVDTDPCDAIVVSAAQFNDGAGADIVVRKYDGDGGLVWERFEGTPLFDFGNGVGVDARGNVIVVGGQVDPRSNYFDFWTRKYDADGGTLWTSVSDGGGMTSDEFMAVATNTRGSSWSVGISSPAPEDTMAVVVSRDPNGDVRWTRLLELVGSADGWLAVARAADGRIGVAGASQLPFPNDLEAHFAVYPP